MPTYLCHGFRWHRSNIRPFVILNKIEDAAPDWVIGPVTADGILKTLHHHYKYIPKPEDYVGVSTEEVLGQRLDDKTRNDKLLPPPLVKPEHDRVLMHQWSAVKLLEAYDPARTDEHTRPWAFVADVAVRVELHADVTEKLMKHGINCCQKDGSWIFRLRDDLQKDEKVSWFVVVCGDEERAFRGKREVETKDEAWSIIEDQTSGDDNQPATSEHNKGQTNQGGGLSGNGSGGLGRRHGGLPDQQTVLQERPTAGADIHERQALRHRRSGSGSGSIEPEEDSRTRMTRPSTSRSKSQVAKPSLRKKLSRGEGLRGLFRKKSADGYGFDLDSEERPPMPGSRHG